MTFLLLRKCVRICCLGFCRIPTAQKVTRCATYCSGVPNMLGQRNYSHAGVAQNGVSSNETRQRTVWVSASQNIFSNLALEDWMYKNMTFETESVLLLWRNSPCVVIGRHQNPWVECNVTGARANGVQVVRRNSGGGAVYHDLGNMCISFFTARELYARKENLQLITDAVTRSWPVDLEINGRDDILLDQQYKISGTAAKLGGKTAYHHCTLLVDIDKRNLHHYLTSKMLGLESRATKSVRASVRNLREAHAGICFEKLVECISDTYLQQGARQGAAVEYVDPTCSATFPGIDELKRELADWKWVYGKTPKFNLQREFLNLEGREPMKMTLHLEIDQGRLSSVHIEGLESAATAGLAQMITTQLMRVPFQVEHFEKPLDDLYNAIRDVETAKLWLWVKNCFRQIFS